MDKELLIVLKRFAELKRNNFLSDSKDAKSAVEALQTYLNTKFPCDLDALSGFADMYRQEDFRKNIDTITEIGVADYVAEAIEDYCYN